MFKASGSLKRSVKLHSCDHIVVMGVHLYTDRCLNLSSCFLGYVSRKQKLNTKDVLVWVSESHGAKQAADYIGQYSTNMYVIMNHCRRNIIFRQSSVRIFNQLDEGPQT